MNGGRYVSEFARQMYQQLGMRVFVLSAHTDTHGTVSIARCVGWTCNNPGSIFIILQP